MSASPAGSSPTTLIGKTRVPSAAKLLAALAPPPGTNCDSRCRRIRTGASRETREISPNWYSSATKSPKSTTLFDENCSTISARASRSTDGDDTILFGERFISLASKSNERHRQGRPRQNQAERAIWTSSRGIRLHRSLCEQGYCTRPHGAQVRYHSGGHRRRRIAGDRWRDPSPLALACPFPASGTRNHRRRCGGNNKLLVDARPRR